MSRKDFTWHRETDYFAVAEGRVTNVSDQPLDRVEAVVEFEAADGSFITSGEALTEYQPILPGQTSPWKVIATWNPAMAKGSARVRFKALLGGEIPTEVTE